MLRRVLNVILVVIQSHIHIISESNCYQFGCPLLFVVAKRIKANLDNIGPVCSLKIKHWYILSKDMPFPLYIVFPCIKNNSLSYDPDFLGLKHTLFQSIENWSHVGLLNVLSFKKNGSAFKFHFFAYHPPDVQGLTHLLFILFEEDSFKSSDSISPLLIDFLPYENSSFELLFVISG